ncbi:uncharacterized protein LOC143525682 isoform X3 [Brachyhypopomus gauderio]|uniref:uncharacterized protein LOC143525682 isoform X3 n=1 Tax=Brachyhypopomus gauderio TaxID=698409 RepID=UPI004042F744
MMTYFPVKYCGVLFIEENTVNVIPSKWFQDGESWWPNYPTDQRINKAIKNCEEPGPGWKKFTARIICEKDDLTDAKRKIKQYLDTDIAGLQSEDEGSQKRRKIKKKYLNESDSDSDMSGNEGRTSVRKVNFRLPHIPQPFPPTITDISAKPQGPINEVSRSVASKPFLSRIPNQDPGNSSQICSQGYNTEYSNPEMFSAANPQGQNQDKRFADLSWSVPSRPFDPFVLNHKPGITSFPHSPYDGNNSQICNNEHEGTQVIPGANSQDLFDGRNASASSLLTCPRGMGTEEKCVFRPQFRVGQHSGPISCSGSVRKCPTSAGATDTEITRHAIRWFNLSCDRGGGRQERNKQ